METARIAAAISLSFAALGARGQDTPRWWPEPLTQQAADTAQSIVYERPLAQYNDPLTGQAKQVAAVKCLPSGLYYRAVVDHAPIPAGACLSLRELPLP